MLLSVLFDQKVDILSDLVFIFVVGLTVQTAIQGKSKSKRLRFSVPSLKFLFTS